jgi:hypothetical protein
MDIRNLEAGFSFRGQVDAQLCTHYVFEAHTHYLLLSCIRHEPAANDGYFNMVDKRAVQFVRSRYFGQQGVTPMDVLHRAQRTRHVRSNVEALNILYILVALGQAQIEEENEEQLVVFSVV